MAFNFVLSLILIFTLKYSNIYFNLFSSSDCYDSKKLLQELNNLNIINRLIVNENKNLISALKLKDKIGINASVVKIKNIFKKNSNCFLDHTDGIVIFNNQVIGEVKNKIFTPITKYGKKIAARSRNKNFILMGNINNLKVIYMEDHDKHLLPEEHVYLDDFSYDICIGISQNENIIENKIPWHKIKYVTILKEKK